jgi:hypothetical protein
MFRRLSGYKAQYHYLTLYVASDFDEWHILALGPGLTIHGARQFTEAKAKDDARSMAMSYVHEEKHDDLPVIEQIEWSALAPDEWKSWRR